MKNKLVTVLVVIAVVATLAAAATGGLIWYQKTHIFVERKAYPIRATSLDLREEDISLAHYDALHAQLPDCDVLWNVPFQGGKVASDARSIRITTLTEADCDILCQYFPALEQVDAEGCADYDLLEALQQRLPEVTLSYTVNLGGAAAAPDSEALALKEGDYTLDTLTENLPHLPRLTEVCFLETELTMEQLQALQETFPEVTFNYTVSILGLAYDEATETIDLSELESDDLEQVLSRLAMLPKLSAVELCAADGTTRLEKQEAKTLIEAVPQATVHYEFDFFGERLSTDTEEVVLKNRNIGDEGEEEIRLALDLLPRCSRFVLESCGLSNEVLAKLRDDYRDRTKIVWRVSFAKGSTMTDAEVIRSTYDLTDSNCADLIYCEDVRFMDIGHDEFLKTIEFVKGMPNLEVLIASGSPITDLTPLENCKKLRVLEVANCGYLTDLTPLVGCESLTRLNISNTKVESLAGLEELPLECLVYVRPRVSQQERDEFAEQHPDCLTSYSGYEYAYPWRYDKDNKKLDWYLEIADAFRYPKSPNNAGWYLEKD